MRHRNYGSKLGRQPAHRRATLRNLVTNVIERERITTTLTRARAAKPLVEQMITLGLAAGMRCIALAECNHLFDERFRSPGARERGGNPLALDDVGHQVAQRGAPMRRLAPEFRTIVAMSHKWDLRALRGPRFPPM